MNQPLSLAIQIFYFFWAVLGFSLLSIHLELYSSRKQALVPKYFIGSLTLFTFAPVFFAIGAYWSPALTLANTIYILGFIAFALAIQNLTKKVAKYTTIALTIFAVFYIAAFEYLRQLGPSYFIERVAITVGPAIIASSISLYGIFEVNKKNNSRQLKILMGVLILLILALFIRLQNLIAYGAPGVGSIYQEKEIWILWVRVIAGALLFLSNLSLHNYFFKRNWELKDLATTENIRITELLKEKERLIYGLLKANKTAATGALSASIAHELNQPLGASNLNIQFLRTKLEKGLLNSELGKEVLDSLEADNKRAATIVKSLRSIFTEEDSPTQEVKLDDLVSKVLDIVKPELKSKNIQIQLRVDDDLQIKANSAEIEQVILNLVNNAIQALANFGSLSRKISIVADKAGQSTHLSIADNGAGVPEQFKPQLFELLSTTKRTGMGLGLWLCKHIVSRYGGFIYYEDVVGGGARFVVELPPHRN
jgi:signal transduction histidine kinase